MIITGATNISIKFIPFINDMWKKKSFRSIRSPRKYMERVEEVSYEYVMVTTLKEIYRANTIASSFFFAGDTQSPILGITFHERSP